ncbi:MAG: hypothetical protein ACI9C9_003010 [Marivirga sp.]|jgi:hypothetical protein
MKMILYIFTIFSFVFSACDATEQQSPGDVNLNFDLVVGDSDLSFESTKYINAAANEFTINSFWMYLSNISFQGVNGTQDYTLEPNYYLIEQNISTEKLAIMLKVIPAGDYAKITFSIGIDEPTNTDISAVKGDLDPARAWNWNSGYKFVSLEGNYRADDQTSRGLIMHIGLNQNYKTLTYNFKQALNVNNNKSEVDFAVDILKMFEGQHTIDFSITNTIKAQPVESGEVADNYAAAMIQLID